jgi:hypothetical protein
MPSSSANAAIERWCGGTICLSTASLRSNEYFIHDLVSPPGGF